MKSETYLSAKIQDDGRVNVDIYGPANKLIPLLEEETVSIFKNLKDECYLDTLKVMCLFFKNIAERVFGDDL